MYVLHIYRMSYNSLSPAKGKKIPSGVSVSVSLASFSMAE